MLNIKRAISLVIFALVIILNSFSQENESRTIKIMTYNIWNGFDWGKDTLRKKNLTEWIKKQSPDVLALQELCGYTEEKLKEDALKWGHQYVKILKTNGYPTALTSNQPINIKDRVEKPLWHGLLHCESYGIDFYIVHLSPSDCNFRLKEARFITESINNSNQDAYIILGDFNAHSPFDAHWLEKKSNLRNKLLGDKKNKYTNLRNEAFDYSVISEFLACPAVDVCLTRIKHQEAYTFPTPALIGKYNTTAQSVVQDRQRIDYILASPSLAKRCTKAEIYNQKETHQLSDHYPIIAEFKIFINEKVTLNNPNKKAE